jgi:hypothetical protein
VEKSRGEDFTVRDVVLAFLMAESKEIAFRYIPDTRNRALLIDLGEENPVWFQRNKIILDEQNYTLTGERDMINHKLEAKRREEENHNSAPTVTG